MKEYIIGIDVGGTNIKAVLMNKKKKVSSLEIKTNKKDVVKQIFEVIEKLSKEIDKKNILGVGIGVPGILDKNREKIIMSPNLTSLNNVKLKEIVSKKTGLKVKVENDVKCLGFSKYNDLVKKGVRNFVFFAIGTGVGGAVFIDGKLYLGKGRAGEFGHIIVEKEGLKCSCGNRGCLEEYVSKRGIEQIANEFGINKDIFEIFKLAKKGDKKAIETFEIAGKYLGIAFSDIVKIFDPDLILVGGGISNAGDFLLKPAINEMKKRTFFDCCPVKETNSSKYEGAIGAVNMFLN